MSAVERFVMYGVEAKTGLPKEGYAYSWKINEFGNWVRIFDYEVLSSALTQAREEIAGLRRVLQKAKPALEQSSVCFDSITSLDEEDDDGKGYSVTCKAVKKTVDRALKAVVAELGGRND